MANIFESFNNFNAFKKLQEIKNAMEEEEKARIEQIEQERIKRHKIAHIFKSIEEALDYCESNPGQYICMYADHVCYSDQVKAFIVHGQRSDYDGINFWEIRTEKTRSQIIDENNAHISFINSKYPNDAHIWFDEYGFLKHIYKLGVY